MYASFPIKGIVDKEKKGIFDKEILRYYCKVTCDGLASRSGGVEILLPLHATKTGINYGSYEPVGSKASLLPTAKL